MDISSSYFRSKLLLRITLVFWLIAKGISWRVWSGHHFFPIIPVFDFLSAIPQSVHIGLFVVSIITSLILLVVPDAWRFLLVLLAVDILSCLLDYSRWQPWEYQYLFIIAVYVINRKNTAQVLNAFLFIIAATYLYSGIQKMNSGFMYVIWENVILQSIFKSHSANGWPLWVGYLGFIIPAIEFLSGLGLFMTAYRRLAAISLISMHLFILYILGPWGLSYNVVIWPWNVMMAMSLGVLVMSKTSDWLPDLENMRLGWNKLIILFWLILPALNFVGLWDHYLSCSLYSGKTPIVSICIDRSKLPRELQPYTQNIALGTLCDGKTTISLQLWAMNEMKVQPYPQMRVYQKIKTNFLNRYPASDAIFLYHSYPYLNNDWRELR